MKKYRKVIVLLAVMTALLCCFSTTAFAFSKGDAQAAVDSAGKEAVAGNVFIWFLCAVAFLKVSQKIDSFMGSLGINVGHTGGSMIAEALIAARGISTARNFGGGFAGRGARGTAGASGPAGMAGVMGAMSGGLAGVVGRQFGAGAVKNATGKSGGGLGGKMFASSMEKGGSFANGVIGSVAAGSIAAAGTMKGEAAVKGLHSFMGTTGQTDAPSFSDVEIGGGRITGMETTGDQPEGIAFGMYHADQYMAPEGDYSTLTAADGSKWFKQYAADTVDKTPYMAPDGKIAYNEKIVKKLPKTPPRKDRV